LDKAHLNVILYIQFGIGLRDSSFSHGILRSDVILYIQFGIGLRYSNFSHRNLRLV